MTLTPTTRYITDLDDDTVTVYSGVVDPDSILGETAPRVTEAVFIEVDSVTGEAYFDTASAVRLAHAILEQVVLIAEEA